MRRKRTVVVTQESSNALKFVGKTINNIKILKRITEKMNGYSYKKTVYDVRYLCRCLSCGSEFYRHRSSLKNSNFSCLCKKSKGSATIVNGLFTGNKRDAKRRNLSFNLKYNFFKKLILSPCFYCGIKSSLFKKTKYASLHYNGIDRINSALGYEKKNVAPCCSNCNRCKWEMSHKDFIAHIERIYHHVTRK